MRILKPLWCWITYSHDFEWYDDVYGDFINVMNCRSLWRCKTCGWFAKSDFLGEP